MIAMHEGSSRARTACALRRDLADQSRRHDQHFASATPRRLVAALAYNPFAIGIGLDEDTAASSAQTIPWKWKAAARSPSSMPTPAVFVDVQRRRRQAGLPVGLSGHILTAGATFNSPAQGLGRQLGATKVDPSTKPYSTSEVQSRLVIPAKRVLTAVWLVSSAVALHKSLIPFRGMNDSKILNYRF